MHRLEDNLGPIKSDDTDTAPNIESKLEEKIIIDPKTIEKPIYYPDHPFIAKLKDLGKDELQAGAIDLVTTTIMGFILDAHARQKILPFTGPVTEKFWFVYTHAREAKKIYEKESEYKRKEYNYYLKEGIKHGFSNLVKDMIYHDPLYWVFVHDALQMFPVSKLLVPAVTAACYITSVLIAAGEDVIVDEIRHAHNKKRELKAGFQSEKYYESRFRILNEKNPETLLEDLTAKFNLKNQGTVQYNDIYFDIEKKGFSGREVKLRLRNRKKLEFEKKLEKYYTDETISMDESKINADNSGLNTIQIIYTRTYKEKRKKKEEDNQEERYKDEHDYYPATKEKMYAYVKPGTKRIEDIDNPYVRKIVNTLIIDRQKSQEITFERTIIRNNELMFCADKISCERPFYIFEVKIRKDTKLMIEAMKYIMEKYSNQIVQTTHGKYDMLV